MAVWPAVTVAVVAPPLPGPSDKSVPVPVRLTVCGLPASLSVMVTAAFRLPVKVGAKLTGIVQLAPALTLAPQVSAPFATSALFAPPITMPLTVNVPAPLFVSVTVCAVLVVPNS